MKSQQTSAKRKRSPRTKWGAPHKKRGYIPRAKQAAVVGLSLSGAKKIEIARKLGIDRETVTRILSQEENELLLQGYRQALTRIVPDALVQASNLVDQGDRQMVTDVLRGSRVFIDRHEVATVQEPERTYDSAKVAFYERYSRWPTHEEAVKFDKTIIRKPKVKGILTEQDAK